MNKSWEQHASWAESIDEFLTQANQTLSARLRLSTLPSVKQEISGATELRTKVAEAFEVLASIQAWSVNLLPSVDENHQQDVEKSLSDWRNALQLVSIGTCALLALESNIEQLIVSQKPHVLVTHISMIGTTV